MNPALRPLRCLLFLAAFASAALAQTEKWGVYEVALPGPADGNPFADVELGATFSQGAASVQVHGFYDGNGTYRIRFMPGATGEWRYVTHANRPELDGKTGSFTAIAPSAGNHGPVHVAHTYHFAYDDGTPYRELGTTCYAWVHQPEALEEQTLRTLADAPFNKIRFCVFPKWYEHNRSEPIFYPYEGTPPNHWDFTRFNPAFFRHFEKRIQQLGALGIEADIILFHPYDQGHWGFDRMGAKNDDFYLHYVVARFSAYRNVWWSMANEYDFVRNKTESDWDRFFQIVQADDPYHHLRSIHNGGMIYDNRHPWVTHSSIQNGSAVLNPGAAELYREAFRKPVVYDEVKYEGNISSRWGQLTPQEMVVRFWNGYVAGTYVGHGETYESPDDVLWWSKGGVLHGQSPARLKFLRRVMEGAPPEGINPIDKWQEKDLNVGGKPGEYYLVYFGREPMSSWKFELYKTGLKGGEKFKAEVLDTWNMTVADAGTFTTQAESKTNNYYFEDAQQRSIALPGRPYLAIRLTRVP
ncbi:MAG TPA: DUF5060 domain-containing protein [Opitutaceae bacterium]|nr:DUF5060 domain-containing protein [Opitutaceae bacterium]